MVAMTPEDSAHERKYIRNVPARLWWRLRLLSVERDTPISKLIIEAIGDYLDEADQEKEENK